jgi:hypothetical protein
MFGAYRRGANIVEEIRSRLARHQLDTDPDFNEVHVDEKVDIVTLREVFFYWESSSWLKSAWTRVGRRSRSQCACC